jgi:hypothetical protein
VPLVLPVLHYLIVQVRLLERLLERLLACLALLSLSEP